MKLAIVDDLGNAADSVVTDAPGDVGAVAEEFIAEHGCVDAVGVRVVHGGAAFDHAVVVTADVLAQLEPLGDLAPLHNPPAVAAMRSLLQRMPGTPVVACFDTAFHATMPAEASTYAIPERWRRAWGIRRFGFHGLNHAYVSRRAAQLLGREGDPSLRLVTAHLGAGASLAAVAGGRSVDTTMGFTPMDGLVMATRSGALDPGAVLWLLQHTPLTAAAIGQALAHESGLLGLGGSADMRDVVNRAASGDARCILARDVYVHRLCSLVGAMVASLGGIDGLVFTGGVGEGSAEIRRRAVERLAFLGAEITAEANDHHPPGDAIISPAASPVAVMVIAAREDVEIARQVRDVVNGR